MGERVSSLLLIDLKETIKEDRDTATIVGEYTFHDVKFIIEEFLKNNYKIETINIPETYGGKAFVIITFIKREIESKKYKEIVDSICDIQNSLENISVSIARNQDY